MILNKSKSKTAAAYVLFAILLIACGAVGYLVINKPTEQPKTLVQTAATPETVDLKIKGNRKSKIYHLKGCPNYNDIAERNVVWFKTAEEAESAGFRIAQNC